MTDSDLFDEAPRIPGGANGGKRPGAGRKKGTVVDQDEYAIYAKARAAKEKANAGLAQIELLRKEGAFVPREEVQQATATAFAVISQTLRAIPDNIERRLGTTPELAEEVGKLIDTAMADLAADLEVMCTKAYE